MATQALPRRRPIRRKPRRTSAGWLAWWPLLLAVIATPFAVRAAEILPLMGAGGLVRLRLLFPFPLLVQQHAGWSQGLMYTQFPLYAVLLVLVHRRRSFLSGLLLVIALHLVAVAAVWVLPSF